MVDFLVGRLVIKWVGGWVGGWVGEGVDGGVGGWVGGWVCSLPERMSRVGFMLCLWGRFGMVKGVTRGGGRR